MRIYFVLANLPCYGTMTQVRGQFKLHLMRWSLVTYRLMFWILLLACRSACCVSEGAAWWLGWLAPSGPPIRSARLVPHVVGSGASQLGHSQPQRPTVGRPWGSLHSPSPVAMTPPSPKTPTDTLPLLSPLLVDVGPHAAPRSWTDTSQPLAFSNDDNWVFSRSVTYKIS